MAMSNQDKEWRAFAISELRKGFDEEPYGLLMGAPYTFKWCAYDDLEFFDTSLEDLDLGWAPERIAQIDDQTDLTREELRQWRVAAARDQAASDEAGVAWIVPLQMPGSKERWGLFLGHGGEAPEDEPTLCGVFDTPKEAVDWIRANGEIDEETGWEASQL